MDRHIVKLSILAGKIALFINSRITANQIATTPEEWLSAIKLMDGDYRRKLCRAAYTACFKKMFGKIQNMNNPNQQVQNSILVLDFYNLAYELIQNWIEQKIKKLKINENTVNIFCTFIIYGPCTKLAQIAEMKLLQNPVPDFLRIIITRAPFQVQLNFAKSYLESCHDEQDPHDHYEILMMIIQYCKDSEITSIAIKQLAELERNHRLFTAAASA